MAKRRSLLEGLKSASKADPKKEAEFVYRPVKPRAEREITEDKAQPPAEPKADLQPPRTAVPAVLTRGGRVPFTTRLRADIGAALKRASLERQLAGQEPSEIQDILDIALEPWLRANGYLK